MSRLKSPPRKSTRTESTPGVVTLDMVAQLAGVSASTVSRILNGTAKVTDDKRAAVDAAITELGFVPNPMARGLAGGRTLSIGVITQAIDSPFYGGSLRGIEDELDRAGYSPLFVSGHWNAAEEARCIAMLQARRVDGIIVLTGRMSDNALRTCAKRMPLVVTGRTLKAKNLVALNFNNTEAARLATQHLIDLGHRRIAFIAGDAVHPDAMERQAGYRAALQAAGIAFNPELVVPGLFTEESGLTAVNRLLDSRHRFTAIFASNDQMALGASLALHRRGLRVPQDVSVVGFDDLPVARFVVPPLTTVQNPAYEMGQLAAGVMLQLLRGEKPQAEVPLPNVMVRESTGRCPRT